MNNTEREQVEEIKESLVLFVKSDDAGEALAGRLIKALLAIIERQEKEIAEWERRHPKVKSSPPGSFQKARGCLAPDDKEQP